MSERLPRDIEALAALFKAGGWDELRVEGEGVSLLLSNDPNTIGLDGGNAGNSVRAEPVEALSSAPKKESPSTGSGKTEEEADPKWTAVVAPNLGTFYRSPKPGSPPIVEVGQHIAADAEICLLEVMKLFTSVKAGVAGTVRRICAADAELVTGGQTLFYIEGD